MAKKFAGKWVGQYTYGPTYQEELRGRSVSFTLDMEVGSYGAVTGRIADAYADILVAENWATIQGRIRGKAIKFVKVYRNLWTMTQHDEIRVHLGHPSQEVHYTGNFQDDEFTGEWRIHSAFVGVDGRVEERVDRGSWSMRREG
jgi:hypothetical protein